MTSATVSSVTSTDSELLPVVVVGAGPVGLAAAAHLHERGQDVVVLEAGPRPAAGVRDWAHVRLFSPWSQLVDAAARRLLDRTGWTAPASDVHPTGGEWVAGYLDPLARALGDAVRLDHRVRAVTRQDLDRLSDMHRDDRPFTVLVDTPEGQRRISARAVVDASGTSTSPNPIGADGLPAVGEEEAGQHITRTIPDLADPVVRARHAGRHTAVVGAGHSAQTAILALAGVAEAEPGTTVTWVLRRGLDPSRVGGGAADQLPRRGALGLAAQAAVRSGAVSVVEGFRPVAVEGVADRGGAGVVLVAADGRRLEEVDHIVGLTGYRPDLSLESELRLDLDPTTQAPRALGPLIDPNVHSPSARLRRTDSDGGRTPAPPVAATVHCGTVPPHGEYELRHPEADLYLAGMKSYGRAPTFLALTGYEQVRSIAAALAGDHDSAARVELCLPETGVCGGTGLGDGTAAAVDDAPSAAPAGLPVVGAGCC